MDMQIPTAPKWFNVILEEIKKEEKEKTLSPPIQNEDR